jgi:transposase
LVLVEQTLRNWVKLSAAGKLTGAGTKPVTQEQMDLSRLRAENVRLKRECEILKNGPHGAPGPFCIETWGYPQQRVGCLQ